MKKKGLVIGGGVLVIIIAVVAYMSLTGGGVTAEDQKAAEEVQGSVDKALDQENIEMPTETNAVTDSLENAIDLEEFDPNDI